MEAKASMEQGVKDYLNPHDRFAERMKKSMRSMKSMKGSMNSSEDEKAIEDQ